MTTGGGVREWEGVVVVLAFVVVVVIHNNNNNKYSLFQIIT